METLAYDFTNSKPWGDMLYEEQQTRKMALLQMPRPEWLACVNAYFTTLRGNGRALISALEWFQQMETERAAFQAPVSVPEMDEETRNWRVWQDMVEDPEKYGSDIGEWIALDEELRRGPKRWRVDAYWYGKVRELEAQEQEAAATRIQSLWRGYQTRCVMAPRFNCARCLSHEVCWVPFEDRNHWMCRECAREWSVVLRVLAEEEEREEELRELAEKIEAAEAMQDVCDDCGETLAQYATPMNSAVLCADCVHDWTPCELSGCNAIVRLGTWCDNHCRSCSAPLNTELTHSGDGFCCTDCRYDYMKESWKD
jgi:hypothetical protein